MRSCWRSSRAASGAAMRPLLQAFKYVTTLDTARTGSHWVLLINLAISYRRHSNHTQV
jgi:hypothetical protein